MFIERLFFMAAFFALFSNCGKLVVLENHRFYLDLVVVKEEWFVLFMLIYFISRMPETEYRKTVLRRLKFFLFLCSAGGIAKYRSDKVTGAVPNKA